MARDRPDRRGPRDDGDQTCRLPQRRRGTGGTGARDDGGGSIFRGGLRVQGEARRPDQAGVLGWHRSLSVAKRLEDGIFRWPKIENGVMKLSAAQLSALLEGLYWRRVHEARDTVAPTQ